MKDPFCKGICIGKSNIRGMEAGPLFRFHDGKLLTFQWFVFAVYRVRTRVVKIP